MKKNIITCTGLTGIYKDKHIEIHIGEHADDCKVLVDGKDISGACIGVHIHIRTGDPTKLVIERIKEDE